MTKLFADLPIGHFFISWGVKYIKTRPYKTLLGNPANCFAIIPWWGECMLSDLATVKDIGRLGKAADKWE